MESIIHKLKAAKEAEESTITTSTLYNNGKQPDVSVGIVSGQKIHFSLNKPYLAKGEVVTGEQEVEFSEGGVLRNGNQYSSLTLPSTELRCLLLPERCHYRRQLPLGTQGNTDLL